MNDANQKLPFDEAKLDVLAEVAVRVGLNIQPGQQLVLTAPTEALPLVRRIARAAYKAGAHLVTPLLSDDEITLARYEHAPDEAFDMSSDWLFQGMADAYGDNAARMAIAGGDPMLLAAQDPEKVARAGKAMSLAYKPAIKKITNYEINWNIAAYPTEGWARQVFPDLPIDIAIAQLAEAIFACSRIEGDDPIAAWAAHNARLRAKSEWLTAHNFDALHFTGPGTDLMVGLAEGHEWKGGATSAQNDIICNPNIPTEEVFTTPHARKVEGVVRASKPLAHQGNVIDGIEVRFEGGKIVEAKASRGEEAFLKLIDSDEGARRLGEVALVPHSSPISQTGLLFYNTLFDENAACHIALGQCYSDCFVGGAGLTAEQVEEQGGNSSMIHVDWMIGSGEIDIDGITQDGKKVPVFRKGEWA
ncbi:MAG: aminopeptidase [Rhodobacteraceae bacterium]|nr:aminopeptidase [Paracoccaceae bacterium]